MARVSVELGNREPDFGWPRQPHDVVWGYHWELTWKLPLRTNSWFPTSANCAEVPTDLSPIALTITVKLVEWAKRWTD